MDLLKSAAERRDALRIEAEPVHPADESGVFDLDASIHHDTSGGWLTDSRVSTEHDVDGTDFI